jgi:single-stranded DNA-binding protein
MATKISATSLSKTNGKSALPKKVTSIAKADVEVDYSLNDLLLRGRVSAAAVEKELPSGDKVVEFRLIITRLERGGVDTLDIAAWSSKMRRSALSLKEGEWIEIAGSIHRRFWSGAAGVASRWQVEAAEIVRI